MPSFEHPWLLLGLLAVPLLLVVRVFAARAERKRLRRFVRPALWRKVGVRPPTGRPLSTALWLASVAAAVLALAGPLWGLGETVTPTGGRNLVVAIDVSASMASADEVPSRLGRAAAVVRRLAAHMPRTRMALVLFADRARLAVPLTMDREFLFGRLPSSPYEVGDLPPGTRLRNLVDVMAAVVPDMDLESSAGLIISDGGFHDYSTVSAAHSATQRALTISTVGVGGADSVPVPDGRGGVLTDAGGDTVLTALDAGPLRELARSTGGVYLEASEARRLAEGLQGIMGSGGLRSVSGAALAPARRFHLFVLAAVLLGAAAWVAERRLL